MVNDFLLAIHRLHRTEVTPRLPLAKEIIFHFAHETRVDGWVAFRGPEWTRTGRFMEFDSILVAAGGTFTLAMFTYEMADSMSLFQYTTHKQSEKIDWMKNGF